MLDKVEKIFLVQSAGVFDFQGQTQRAMPQATEKQQNHNN